MKSPLHFFHRPLSRLVAGWCAVVLYMGAFTSFGPLFAALVGGMDVDHHVQLAADADGVRVVLHHGEACLHGHHHGLVAQALTLMAEPPSQSDPDHILQFHASAAADKQKRLLFADESRGDLLDAAVPALAETSCFRSLIIHPSVPSRPLPVIGRQLLYLRSTVLLI